MTVGRRLLFFYFIRRTMYQLDTNVRKSNKEKERENGDFAALSIDKYDYLSSREIDRQGYKVIATSEASPCYLFNLDSEYCVRGKGFVPG